MTLYKLMDELSAHCLADGRRHEMGVLGSARWVCNARLQEFVLRGDASPDVLDVFHEALSRVEELEPTREELLLAAKLEAASGELRLPLDTGESQLAAVVAFRGGLLLTGDKRAIAALEHLSSGDTSELDSLTGRVASLEHVMMTLILHLGATRVRRAVCESPTADTAMRLAFTCGGTPSDSPPQGLLSYLNAVQASATRLCTDAQSLCWESIGDSKPVTVADFAG